MVNFLTLLRALEVNIDLRHVNHIRYYYYLLEDYPDSSPIFQFEFDDHNTSFFLQKVRENMTKEICLMTEKYLISNLLYIWEKSVRQENACATVKSDDKKSLLPQKKIFKRIDVKVLARILHDFAQFCTFFARNHEILRLHSNNCSEGEASHSPSNGISERLRSVHSRLRWVTGSHRCSTVTDEEKVIAYASRLYSKAERNYCVTRRELLAEVYFCRHFRQYLLGRNFLIRTDHSFTWLRLTPDPVGQQSRWLKQLEEYSFVVQHRKGKKHENADAMSRIPCKQCHQIDDSMDMSENHVNMVINGRNCEVDWSKASLEKSKTEDPQIGEFQALKLNYQDIKPDVKDIIGCSEDTKTLWYQWGDLRKGSCIEII